MYGPQAVPVLNSINNSHQGIKTLTNFIPKLASDEKHKKKSKFSAHFIGLLNFLQTMTLGSMRQWQTMNMTEFKSSYENFIKIEALRRQTSSLEGWRDLTRMQDKLTNDSIQSWMNFKKEVTQSRPSQTPGMEGPLQGPA